MIEVFSNFVSYRPQHIMRTDGKSSPSPSQLLTDSTLTIAELVRVGHVEQKYRNKNSCPGGNFYLPRPLNCMSVFSVRDWAGGASE